MLVRALCGNALELGAICCQPPPDRWLSRILMWTCRGHHTVGRPRNTWDSTLQNFCRYQHLGNWSFFFEPWQGMRTGGQMCCHGSYSFAPNHEQVHVKGIHVYMALLFSPVPFTGCVRAYRFHLTSPHIQHMQPSH